MLFHNGDGRITSEQRLPGHHLGQYAGQAIDVGGRGGLLAVPDLRRDIGGRADNAAAETPTVLRKARRLPELLDMSLSP